MNRIFLTGNLTKDPELTETQSGIKICRFGLAVKRGYKSNGEEPKTDFFNVIAWRGLAETVAKYSRKGNKVLVVGSVEFRETTDSDGAKRRFTDVIAQDVEFLSSKNKEQTELEPAEEQSPFDDDGDIPF